MLTAEQIYSATNGGLDIILRLFPDAEKCINNRSHKFKMREEKTASASIKKLETGIWIVTDFGDEMRGKNAITLVMELQRLDFPQALSWIAQQFNIQTAAAPLTFAKPIISSRAATDEDTENTYSYVFKDFTDAEIKLILSQHTISYLGNEYREAAIQIFERYSFKCLKSYSICKKHKTTGNLIVYTFESTADYPQFIWDCRTFKKIYRPLERDPAYPRFLYDGKIADGYIFGYEVAAKAHAELLDLNSEEEEETDKKPKKKKKQKLEHVTLCSGGSDALNLAALKHYPVWLNSETAALSAGQYRSLAAIAETVYNIPDIDSTGLKKAHELALEYLDIRTIYLPAELTKHHAANGKPRKDLRDYLNHYKAYSFFELLKVAYPYRFWDERHQYNKEGEYTGINYDVRNKRLYNFLSKNGFYRYKSEAAKEGYIFIRISGNVVSEITAKDIRDFVNDFLELRKYDDKLLDTFLRSTQLSESSLSNLPFIEIDFTDTAPGAQWLFFKNCVAEVTAESIVKHKPGSIEKYVWEKEIINRNFEPELQPQFTVNETYTDIQLHQPCMLLQYLCNASRIYWRKELEEMPANAEYKERYKFAVDGPNLTAEEIAIQKQHLLNKLYSIGYLLHTYKNSSKAWAVWAMDNKISDANESHGGSGKSVTYKGLLYLKNNVQLEGRNPKLIDNPHVYENITQHTDLVLIDDASRWLKFDFFFSAITGPLNVNPKNNKQYVIEFDNVPKFIFTSNFPPREADPSIERRLLYTVFSDYYHFNRLDEYREERKISDDFGLNFYTDFSADEWNRTLNFYCECLKLYLSCPDKINPPLDNVIKRNLKAAMGDNFQDWADVYFSKDSGKLDIEFSRSESFEDCKRSTGVKLTPQQFKAALRAWTIYNGYELNPAEVAKSGRITRHITALNDKGESVQKNVEMFYIKTKFEDPAESSAEPLPF